MKERGIQEDAEGNRKLPEMDVVSQEYPKTTVDSGHLHVSLSTRLMSILRRSIIRGWSRGPEVTGGRIWMWRSTRKDWKWI